MSESEEQHWKLEVFRDKLWHSLRARFFLRFHALLIVGFAIFCGWLSNILLLQQGLSIMWLRYLLAVLCGYGAFVLGVYVWIEYSGIREYIKSHRASELVGDHVPREPDIARGSWYDGLGIPFDLWIFSWVRPLLVFSGDLVFCLLFLWRISGCRCCVVFR